MFLGVSDCRGDLRELTAHLSQLAERHADGDYTCDDAVQEEPPFGKSQMLKSDRLRQPATKQGS